MAKYSFTAAVILLLFAVPAGAATPAENLAKKKNEWFATDDGKSAMACILSWQTKHGDWPKNGDTTKKKYSGDPSKLRGTFDNGATTGELRALARAFTVTKEPSYERAFITGFEHVLKAQYPSGGWPQYFPLRKGYYSRITFNDDCMIRIMTFLNEVAHLPDYAFVDQARREAAQKALDKGIDCILKCQITVDGKPTVWCAQHDEKSFAPANARSYELASLSGAESARVLKFLISLPDPSPEVVRSVKAGVAWYQESKIEGFRFERSANSPPLIEDPKARPLWARFYEIETNRPFFCDRDGIPKYDLREIGEERRLGYSWYGNWGESLINAYNKWPHR